MGESTCRTLSNRTRTPAVQRIAPVDAFEHVTQLSRGDRDDAPGLRRGRRGWRRPDKTAALQSLGVKRHAETVVPEDLDQVATSATKYKQITGMWVALQSFLHLQSQPVHAAPHVSVPRGDPHPHTTANRDHRRSALTTAAVSSGGVSAGMRSRTVPANSTSIGGAGSNAARSLPPVAIAAITTWENPLLALPSSCPPAINLPGTNRRAPGDIGDNRARRKRRRDDRSLLLLTPRPAPLGPGENLDSAHPDVLCTSAAPMLAPVRTSGLNRSGGARRPSPEAYYDCAGRWDLTR